MLLPALNKAREAAQRISCASQMRQRVLGLTMYTNDSNGDVPRGMIYDDAEAAGRDSTLLGNIVYRQDFYCLGRYLAGNGSLGSGKVFWCPSAAQIDPDAATYGHWNDPAYDSYQYLIIGYFYCLRPMACEQMDASYAEYHLSVDKWAPKAKLWMSANTSDPNQLVTNSAQIPVFGDKTWLPSPLPVGNPLNGAGQPYLHGMHPYGNVPAKGANTAFMDGHVDWVPASKLQPMGQLYAKRYYGWWLGYPE
jgi:prepilin-type processing-associated H-X9-DG protein